MDEIGAVQRFNAAINARDLDALAARMTDDHRFIDMEDNRVDGRAACVEAWRSFFATFPDYQNHFDRVVALDDRVVVRGRSSCSIAELDGPALWSAELEGGLVREWRVHEDTDANRRSLGLD